MLNNDDLMLDEIYNEVCKSAVGVSTLKILEPSRSPFAARARRPLLFLTVSPRSIETPVLRRLLTEDCGGIQVSGR